MTYVLDIDVPFRAAYCKLLQDIRAQGKQVSPRGLHTREILGAVITIRPVDGFFDTLATSCGRQLSMRVAAVEALQLVGGFCNPNAMVAASQHFANFMDGGSFWGGYGVRTRSQVPLIIDRLRMDPDTRQAQISFWDPAYDLVNGARDYPCTTAMRFFVRGNTLHGHVTMRSNDAFRGLPYDIFVFTQLQHAIASVLGLQVGTYQHHVSSLHLYASDDDAIDLVRGVGGRSNDPVLVRRGATTPWETITAFIRDTMSLGISYGSSDWSDPAGAEWYARQWAMVTS